ncbi:hypothetical protein K7432_015244 [Basidiobolus ranarum]|uniref:Uncharacterized protein n=1 Tax=Basidiobolus ranarum TaxID=34480 RepID=A0ABR2WGD7_9FUNG
MVVLEENCGPDIYCLPKPDETWMLGKLQSGMIRWNHNHPLFKVQGFVDVRLFEMTDTRNPVKEWINIQNNDGLLTVGLSNDIEWFPKVQGNRENVSILRQFRLMITPHGDWSEHQPWGPIFNIEEPPPSTSQNSPTNSQNTNVNESNKLERPSISLYGTQPTGDIRDGEAIISGNVRRRQPPKTVCLTFDEVDTLPTHGPDSLGHTDPSSFILNSNQRIEMDPESKKSTELDSGKLQNSLRLTAKDARMIADTYRQLLRKPSWSGKDIETLQRTNSHYSDELMRRELEAEGTGVKHVTWTTMAAPEIVPEEQTWSRNSIFVESSAPRQNIS